LGDGKFLDSAVMLPLSFIPQSPEAVDLINGIAERVLAHEATDRHRRRTAAAEASLRQAIGGIVAGVLRRWAGSTPRPAFRATSASSFTGGPVSYRAFVRGLDALKELGLIHSVSGKRFLLFSGQWAGRAVRLWPTQWLLDLAQAHGVGPTIARKVFKLEPPRSIPKVVSPIEVRSFNGRRGRQKVKGQNITVDVCEPRWRKVLLDVEAFNDLAATFEVTGCTPPRWSRKFTMDPRLGGRWYALGGDLGAVYLNMPEAERLQSIRIGGEPVVEVDISSSHLTILHGLFGRPLPKGDLYEAVPTVPRHIVKAWLTFVLGLGKAVPRWSRSPTVEQKAYDPKTIYNAMLGAYPFLGDLRSIVPATLRASYGDQPQLVPLYLQGIEAAALTGAMRHVGHRGHLPLPTHDGLIVAKSVENSAKEGLLTGFSHYAKVLPKLDVSRHDGR
jgi:hypothetical protein